MFEKFNALVNEPMSAHTTLKLGGPSQPSCTREATVPWMWGSSSRPLPLALGN